MSSKIPGGLVTKPAAPGYEMVRVGGSQGNPQGFPNQAQLNQMAQFGGGAGVPFGNFPGNLGFNAAALFQQSESIVITSNSRNSSTVLSYQTHHPVIF